MLSAKQQNEILDFMVTEARRVKFGRLLVEMTIMDGQVKNIQAETRRSQNIDRDSDQ